MRGGKPNNPSLEMDGITDLPSGRPYIFADIGKSRYFLYSITFKEDMILRTVYKGGLDLVPMYGVIENRIY